MPTGLIYLAPNICVIILVAQRTFLKSVATRISVINDQATNLLFGRVGMTGKVEEN